MPETQADYLTRLGIDQWLPRQPLTHAAPSPDWVYRFVHPGELLDEAADLSLSDSGAGAGVGSSKASPHAEQRAIAHIHQVLDDEPAPVGEPVERSREAATQATPSLRAEIPAPRFRIAFVRVGRLLLIDQLPVQGTLGFSEQHSRLLAGIVRSLGEDPRGMSLPVVRSWPLLAGRTLNQGPVEAFKNIQGQVHLMLGEPGVETLVLFGQGLERWVVSLDADFSASEGLQLHPRWNLSLVSTVSLTEALQLPDMKRQIWSDLQPLVRQG